MQDIPTPDSPRSNRKAGLIGGVIGSIGLAASIFALTSTAGASGPVLQAQVTEPAPVVDDDNGDNSEDFEDDEAWAEFDKCIDAVFESQGFDVDGDFEEFDFEPAVSIMDGDDMSFAEFGDGDGSITITKTGDDISVTSDGDVTVEEFDWDDMVVEGITAFDGEIVEGELELFDGFDDEAFEELDEALSTCDDHLPAGIDLDADFDEHDLEFEEFDLEDGDASEPAEVS